MVTLDSRRRNRIVEREMRKFELREASRAAVLRPPRYRNEQPRDRRQDRHAEESSRGWTTTASANPAEPAEGARCVRRPQ